MNNSKLIHALQPGQELTVRFREATGQVLQNMQLMRLTPNNGNPYACVYVTFADDVGISVYITRGSAHGGDIKAFLSKELVAWQAYFSPLNSFNHSYRQSKHFSGKFPLDFT